MNFQEVKYQYQQLVIFLIQQLQMSKAQKHFLKSKWSQDEPIKKEKIKESRKKIMLTDLCPQQKAKIGELMMLVQKQKKNNHELHKINKQIEQNSVLLEQRIKQLIEQNQSKDNQLEDMRKIILELQKQIYEKKQEDKSNQANRNFQDFIERGIQTEDQIKIDILIQTEEKQIKTKRKKIKKHNKKIQTIDWGDQNQIKKHSKSFEKIMKNYQEHKNQRDSNNKHKRTEYSLVGKTHSKSNNILTFQDIKNNKNLLLQQEEEYYLKMQKNRLQNLKSEHLRSRNNQDYEQGTKKSENSDLDSQKQERENKVLKMYKQLKQRNRQKQINLQYDVDQNELNKMLKSNDFKVNKIIKNNREAASHKKSSKMDFYETNLLDLVKSIQK